ncbi:hypothetical protein EU528_09405 [Candidatus Thorarchaeota archaeon]|nr:MAG: hypothetical protein EU528_09405 [Candidatus Thorarchaeota archaeon]
MSNYQRNTSLVICIFAVLVIGAVGIGLLSYYGTNTWNWNQATTDFSFEAEVGATNETVTLDIDIATGAVSITFVDNESLLYHIEVEVQNTTVETDGAPTVTFVSNVIGLDYTAAGVNITLGSGVNYTIDVDVATGGLSVVLGPGAHIGDVSLDTTTGGISLIMTDDVVLMGNASFDLTTVTGGINIVADYPTGIGGSIECAVGVGAVDITATGWTQVTANHYESSDYDTASQTITIVAQTTTGGIDAIVT